MKRAILALLLVCATGYAADEKAPPTETKAYRIMGLCYPERADDLRVAVERQPKIHLDSVDYEHATATFTYNPKEISAESIRNSLGWKGFSLNEKPLPPADKLQTIDIPITILDCKACCLGTYNAISRIEGVEQATVSNKEGHVIALIDTSKTNREALEKALKNASVDLRGNAKDEKPKEDKK